MLIATPDVKEATGLLSGFARLGFAADDAAIGAISSFVLPALDMRVAVGGNGKGQFAAQTRYLLDRCPDANVLICAGSAGRLDDTLNIGDVVVATRTVEYDCKTRISPKPWPCHDPDAALHHEFMDIAATKPFRFRVHAGAVASGDQDIVDASRASELRAGTDTMCAAWEGSGGARAAALTATPFLEVRVISDHADAETDTAFQTNVGPVMAHVAELLVAWSIARRARLSAK